MKVIPPQIYRFGSFTLDTAAPELRKGGEPLQVTAKCLELLCFLIENQGRLITKEEILDQVWEGVEPDEATLTQHIYLLRKAMGKGESDSSFIETVPRVGYRFLAEVRPIGAAPNGREPAAGLPNRHLRHLGPLVPGIGVVLICAALAAAVVIYSDSAKTAPTDLEVGSVTILPFEDLSAEPDVRLGVGIADLVIARLADSGSVRARPTVSVLGLGVAAAGNPAEAGRQLRSEMVVSGSISREAGSVKAAFYVARVRDGKRLFSEIVEVAEGDLFAVQEVVAARVADELINFFEDGKSR